MQLHNAAMAQTKSGNKKPRKLGSRDFIPDRKGEEPPSLELLRGETARAAVECLDALRVGIKRADPNLIKAAAIGAGILSDKAIVLDVRIQARRPDLTARQIDEHRAQQQAIADEIARRKVAALKSGEIDSVEVTPALLEAFESGAEPDPIGRTPHAAAAVNTEPPLA